MSAKWNVIHENSNYIIYKRQKVAHVISSLKYEFYNIYIFKEFGNWYSTLIDNYRCM